MCRLYFIIKVDYLQKQRNQRAVKMVLNKTNKPLQKGMVCSRNTCHNQDPLSFIERVRHGCPCKQSTLEQLDKMLKKRCRWAFPLWRVRWIPWRQTQLVLKPPLTSRLSSQLTAQYFSEIIFSVALNTINSLKCWKIKEYAPRKEQ